MTNESLNERIRLIICNGLGVNPVTHSYKFIAEDIVAAMGDASCEVKESGKPCPSPTSLVYNFKNLDGGTHIVNPYQAITDKLASALKLQHQWQLSQGEEEAEGITLNMAAEYCDSTMYDRTADALAEYEALKGEA